MGILRTLKVVQTEKKTPEKAIDIFLKILREIKIKIGRPLRDIATGVGSNIFEQRRIYVMAFGNNNEDASGIEMSIKDIDGWPLIAEEQMISAIQKANASDDCFEGNLKWLQMSLERSFGRLQFVAAAVLTFDPEHPNGEYICKMKLNRMLGIVRKVYAELEAIQSAQPN